MTRPEPYIGITGFMQSGDITAALEAWDCCRFVLADREEEFRRLMVGVLVSSKTLAGKRNKYPNRYPEVERIAGLFPAHPTALNLIHYATDDADTLGEQLRQLEAVGGPNLHGFQLNVPWPHPDALAAIPERFRVVLQIGRAAVAAAGHDPAYIALRLVPYLGKVTDVLVDMSGGLGLPMNIPRTMDLVATIAAALPTLGIGIAGGLDAASLPQVAPVLAAHPFVSFDAEGRLRNEADHLDVERAQDYLLSAASLLSS